MILAGHPDGKRHLVVDRGSFIAQVVESGVVTAAAGTPRGCTQSGPWRDAQRGIRRQTNWGSIRNPKNTGRSVRGIHTVRRPRRSARAVAAATRLGVVASG